MVDPCDDCFDPDLCAARGQCLKRKSAQMDHVPVWSSWWVPMLNGVLVIIASIVLFAAVYLVGSALLN